MILIDIERLEEMAAGLRGSGNTLDGIDGRARSALVQIGRSDLAWSFAQRLATAEETTARLASDLAARADGIRTSQGIFLGLPAAGAPPTSTTAHLGPGTDLSPEAALERLRRLRRLRPGFERLAARGITAPLAALDRERAAITSSLSVGDWQHIALIEAGLDGLEWDPSQGLVANDEVVRRIYDFYGRLYLTDPDLQWAGMAAAVGAMFYGGWQDLYVVRNLADPADRLWYLTQLTSAGPRLEPIRPAFDLIGVPFTQEYLAHLGAAELEWLEVRMLIMQKDIFDDLAWMHVAYRYGGMQALEPHLSGPAQAGVLAAWHDIASGDPARVAAGNESLLRREQEQIIQGHYDTIRTHHGAVGLAMTRVLTMIAGAPIPGSRPYREVVTSRVELPAIGFDRPQIWPPSEWIPVDYQPVTVTVPRGDVSVFDDRWEWIETDMLPAFRVLLDRPQELRELLSTPVEVRAVDHRLLPFLPYPGD